MKKIFYWIGGIAGASLIVLGLNQIRETTSTVIKKYTDRQGREVMLLDYDGDLSTVEEKITRSYSFFEGEEPPEGGYVVKAEFEPPKKRNIKFTKSSGKVNTEISVYDKDGMWRGTTWRLEPRERIEIPIDETPQITEDEIKDEDYGKMAMSLRDHTVKNGILHGDLNSEGIELSYREMVILVDGKRVILEIPSNGNRPDDCLFIRVMGIKHVNGKYIPLDTLIENQAIERGLKHEQETEIKLIDMREMEKCYEIFSDINLDGKITEDELAPIDIDATSEQKTERYRCLMKEIKGLLGL